MVRQQKNETFPCWFISKFSNQLMNPDAKILNLWQATFLITIYSIPPIILISHMVKLISYLQRVALNSTKSEFVNESYALD